MDRKEYPGRREGQSKLVITMTTLSLFGLLGLMFAGVGEAAPTFAQVVLVSTVAWLLFLAGDALWPGARFGRSLLVTVGDDGLQTAEAFVPWTSITEVRYMRQPQSLSEMRRQRQEDAKARREGRAPRTIGGARFQVRVDTVDRGALVLKPAKPRRLADDLEARRERLARRRDESDDRMGAAGYRDVEDRRAPADILLDTSVPRERRIEAFLTMDESERRTALASLAELDMRNALEAAGRA